jgi:transposase
MTTDECDPITAVNTDAETLPDDIDALKAALRAERAARRESEARATGAEAMVAHLKLLIAKLRHDRFGASSERGRKLLDQMELQLEELEATASEAATTAAPDTSSVTAFARRKPVRAPLPGHLPRERVVIEAPSACPCCGGTLAKLGETITETLEVVPRQWKVIQTVREKFTCRSCEKMTQPPAPFHPIARGRAGANLLAMILEAKFGQHLPLNRQSETFAREGIELDVSTLADWVGACSGTLAPLVTLIRTHVMAAARLHGDDTTVPVLAKGKTVTGRLWTYVRDDRPFAGPAPPAAIFIDYMLKRWDAFSRFLQDGRICLTNNAAERALRGIALGRKAWLFAGSDSGGERAASMYSLIQTAKLNDLDPRAWLADVLRRINDHPASRLDALLPWNWDGATQLQRAA